MSLQDALDASRDADFDVTDDGGVIAIGPTGRGNSGDDDPQYTASLLAFSATSTAIGDYIDPRDSEEFAV